MLTAPLLLPSTTGLTIPRINLGLGAAVVVDQPTTIWTVLGSCVAVVLHVPRLGLSGVCHAVLPEPHDRAGARCSESCPSPCFRGQPMSEDLKYVSCCVRYMLEQLSRRGALKVEMVASLYGGADVVAAISSNRSVGSRNLAVALAMLERENIPIAVSDIGGTKGRTIEHNSGNNQTAVRHYESTF
jgi:chemotaxis protein CheD